MLMHNISAGEGWVECKAAQLKFIPLPADDGVGGVWWRQGGQHTAGLQLHLQLGQAPFGGVKLLLHLGQEAVFCRYCGDIV